MRMEFRDESRVQGYADGVLQPRDTDQLGQAIRQAAQSGRQLTVQGAATGLAGGAVPQGGWLLSTRGMNRILGLREDNGRFFLQVQAGVTLSQVEEFLRKPIQGRQYFLPPNPTEKSATLGGAFACNAMGINRLRYGRFSESIAGFIWVTPKGEVLRLKRGDELHGMDATELLAGSEGRLGVAAELELMLLPVPRANWGVFFFFEQSGSARAFTKALAGDYLTACEYFDQAALDLLRPSKQLPAKAREALYLELSGEDDVVLEDCMAGLLGLFEECGGRDEDTWAADDLSEIEKLRALCHAVPELINNEIDKAGVSGAIKYDLDFQSAHVWGQIDICRAEVMQIDIFCFGHVLLGQAHVCLVPHSPEEKIKCEALLERWSAQIAEQGGLLAVENGLGKNKRQLLWKLLPPARQAYIMWLQELFDPIGIMQNGLHSK